MAGYGDEGRLIAGRYRLVERIGRGGMGTVWLAEDELLGRQVAVKKLHPPQPHMDDDELATLFERTRREARAAARISHPNVIVVHDVVDDAGLPSIVMEYVPSVTLGERLKEVGSLSPAEAARIGRGMIAALRAAHRAGVLHRDVKPGNVLLGGDARVVLTDFGIAQASGTSTLTRTGELIGSIDFLSPERIRGVAPGPEADLWALGATLYQAVEGFSAFRRPTAIETAYAIAEEPVKPPANAGALAEAIVGLLAKEPEQRLSMDEAERLLRIPAAEPDTALVEQMRHDGSGRYDTTSVAGTAGRQPQGTTHESYPGRSDASLTDPGLTDPGRSHLEQPDSGRTDSGRTDSGLTHSRLPDSGGHSYAGESSSGSQSYSGAQHPQATIPPQRHSTPPSGPGRPRRNRRAIWIAAVAAVAVLAGGAAFIVKRHSANNTAGGHHTTAPSTPASAPPTAPGTPTDTPATSTAATSVPVDPPPSSPPPVPPGYHLESQKSHGYSVPVPDGWTKQIQKNGDEVNFLDPSGKVGLKISSLQYASNDPYEHWITLEPQTRANVDGYHRERMERTTVFGERAALWEFTFKGTARKWHALDLGFGKPGGTEYAIYLNAPEAQWNAQKPVFDNAVAGFRQTG